MPAFREGDNDLLVQVGAGLWECQTARGPEGRQVFLFDEDKPCRPTDINAHQVAPRMGRASNEDFGHRTSKARLPYNPFNFFEKTQWRKYVEEVQEVCIESCEVGFID